MPILLFDSRYDRGKLHDSHSITCETFQENFSKYRHSVRILKPIPAAKSVILSLHGQEFPNVDA
jgi:hypothetical protein